MTEVLLKKQSELHFVRYAFHALSGSLLAMLCYLVPKLFAVTLIGVLAVCMIAHDFYRLRTPAENERVIRKTAVIMRDTERHNLASSSYFIAGCFFTALLFTREVVVLSLLFLAWGDPAAAWVGNRFGKTKILAGKSVAGAAMCFFVCAFIAALLHLNHGLESIDYVALFLLCGAVGMLAELIPIVRLNDNLTMPLLSALGLSVVGSYYGVAQVL